MFVSSKAFQYGTFHRFDLSLVTAEGEPSLSAVAEVYLYKTPTEYNRSSPISFPVDPWNLPIGLGPSDLLDLPQSRQKVLNQSTLCTTGEWAHHPKEPPWLAGAPVLVPGCSEAPACFLGCSASLRYLSHSLFPTRTVTPTTEPPVLAPFCLLSIGPPKLTGTWDSCSGLCRFLATLLANVLPHWWPRCLGPYPDLGWQRLWPHHALR